ncbi:hypothetical protein AB5I41_06615 [Sphingomonas sp. MMS24-JH45]
MTRYCRRKKMLPSLLWKGLGVGRRSRYGYHPMAFARSGTAPTPNPSLRGRGAKLLEPASLQRHNRAMTNGIEAMGTSLWAR